MKSIESLNASSRIIQASTELNNSNNSVKPLSTPVTTINIHTNKSLQNITHKRSNTVRTIIQRIKNAITKFFDKSPTLKDMCGEVGISWETFSKLSQSAKETVLKCCLSGNDDEISDTNKLKIATNLSEKIKNLNANELCNELSTLKAEIDAYKENLEKELNQQVENSAKAKETFSVLGTCFEGEDNEIINKTINNLIEQNGGKINKNLFNTIKKTLKENFGVTSAGFNKAWADAISRTQGGEKIGGDIQLKFNGNTTSLNLQFTPQNQLSGFPNDTTGIKHYSSAIQHRSLQEANTKVDHAVNLWKQDIEVNNDNMQFLRHGCTRGGEEASKEILLNALMLQHGDAINEWQDNNEPLNLQFTNVQLMTLGHLADYKMPIEQINAFKKLAEKQPIELTTKEGKTIKVNIGKPLLFNFAVNAQHFRKLDSILADSGDKDTIKAQNLESFKQLFGEDFPSISSNIFGGLIKTKLNDQNTTDIQRQQIQTLAKQISEIYQSHPEGLKENPYALPTRVLALTNLLGYASSFNCKSGKDRTGVCAMELSNLCAQMMSRQEISKPMEPISHEEQKNLQAIYKEGSSSKDILKTNTIFQKNLKIQEFLGFNSVGKRFGVDWTKSFEENVENFKA